MTCLLKTTLPGDRTQSTLRSMSKLAPSMAAKVTATSSERPSAARVRRADATLAMLLLVIRGAAAAVIVRKSASVPPRRACSSGGAPFLPTRTPRCPIARPLKRGEAAGCAGASAAESALTDSSIAALFFSCRPEESVATVVVPASSGVSILSMHSNFVMLHEPLLDKHGNCRHVQ